MNNRKVKDVRRQIYFDCICGIISSVLSLIGIIFTAIVFGIKNRIYFTIGITFWICYLIFSIFLILFGIYTWYQEKHYEERKPRKDLKPPIVS
jgi:uncharacterized Tic20 family protein